MKIFTWNKEKNKKLKLERGVGFEDVIVSIKEGRILDIMNHSNYKKYPGQKIFILKINEYAYLVPFTEDREKIFLKTIFASRKATKKYIIK